MKNIIIYCLFIAIFVGLAACGTNNVRPCPDKSIKHNNACTKDCPGVKACNGKTYCNECEAARDGFWVE